MMTTLKKHFVYQADYQHWANDALFVAVDVLDEEARQGNQGLPLESVHKTVNHVLVVTRSWMSRLRQEKEEVGRAEIFVPAWKDLKNTLRLEFREMQRWLEARPEPFFDEQIGYVDNQRQERQIWVRDALTHVMTHAAHQRGQVAAIVTRLGAPAPEMDYITYKGDMERSLENLRATRD